MSPAAEKRVRSSSVHKLLHAPPLGSWVFGGSRKLAFAKRVSIISLNFPPDFATKKIPHVAGEPSDTQKSTMFAAFNRVKKSPYTAGELPSWGST